MFSSQKYVKQLIFQETGAKLNSLKSPLRISAFQASAKPKLTPSLIRISAFQASSKPNFLRNLPRVSLKKVERTPINSEMIALIADYDAGRYLNKIDLSPTLLRFSSILTVILLSILFFSSTHTHAQFYDTIHRPKLEWFEIKTEHFRIIYHEGLDDLA